MPGNKGRSAAGARRDRKKALGMRETGAAKQINTRDLMCAFTRPASARLGRPCWLAWHWHARPTVHMTTYRSASAAVGHTTVVAGDAASTVGIQ